LCLLLSAVAAKRAVERTPIEKETAGFKFSKILELPHKRNAGSTVVAVIRTELVTLDAEMIEYPVPPDVPPVSHETVRQLTSSRAPPALGC
jgi:hypothetical protein